jgi:murein endopeptidase
VCHRTVSGAPSDSVRCTRGLQLATFGNFSGRRAIIHRTVRCTPDSVRCSKEARPPELASLGNAQQPLRYNSPDMSGVHRTVRCILGATAISAPTATCDAFNARAARAEGRRAHTGAPDMEQYMSGVHRTSRRAHKSGAPTVRIQRHW